MRNRKKKSNILGKFFIYTMSKKQLIIFIRKNDSSYTNEELKVLSERSLRDIALILHNIMNDENDIPDIEQKLIIKR